MHTKGPWKADKAGNVRAGRRQVAICGGYMDSANFQQAEDENEANARLIAAAPDLLEACKAALEAIDSLRIDHPWHASLVPILRTAIDKAEER